MAHTRSIPEQVISIPRGQPAEMGDACIYLAQTLLSCPNYLTLMLCCGICSALPLQICCFPLSSALFCCGVMLQLFEFLCFELPVIIARALIQISQIMLLEIELCFEAPIMCPEDLAVMLRDLPELCSAIR